VPWRKKPRLFRGAGRFLPSGPVGPGGSAGKSVPGGGYSGQGPGLGPPREGGDRIGGTSRLGKKRGALFPGKHPGQTQSLGIREGGL